MEKNNKIQVLRGIAIIAVVMIHTLPGGVSQVFFRPFINFAVALFLFLSGYLTAVDNQDWNSFFYKRIGRVAIPYVIWTVLYTLPTFSFVALAKNIITTHAAPTLYYVFVYVQFVLLTPIIGVLGKSRIQWLGWVIAPLSLIVFRYPEAFSVISYNRYVSFVYGISCLGWFSFYYLGLLLRNRLLKISINGKLLLILFACSIIIQMAEGYIWMTAGIENCGTQMKLSAVFTSMLFLLGVYRFIINDHIRINSKLLTLIGDYSFGIYLSHIMVMRILSGIHLYSELPFIVKSIVILGISLLVVSSVSKMVGARMSRWLGLT
ncbi:MAG: acyltransferase [Candidatus Cryptobacteroides sp.]